MSLERGYLSSLLTFKIIEVLTILVLVERLICLRNPSWPSAMVDSYLPVAVVGPLMLPRMDLHGAKASAPYS